MPQIDRRNGKYRARYRDPLGRRRSKTFLRKADAERYLREMQLEVDRGSWLDPSGAQMPLAKWAEEFLSLARRLSATTQQIYRRDLELYILPRFGDYQIGRLPADEIERWLMDEVDAGYAPSSVHRHYRLFRRMLQVAIQKEKILFNPCDRVQPPRVPYREMNFLTFEQGVALAEAHPEPYRAFVYLALDTGMRWSEIVGLRRARLDVRGRKVRVTEQLIRMGPSDWLRKEPKTPSSVRSISLSTFTATILAEHLEHFAEPGADGLVFVNRAGRPIISSSFHTHFFKPALARSGVSCRFHDLRHTSVAFAISTGAHPKAIQSRLGHSSISVTLDRYGHLFPELDEAIAVSFGERFAEVHSSRATNVIHTTFGN